MKNRKMGIATKIFLMMTILIILSDTVLGLIIYKSMTTTMERQLKSHAESIAASSAAHLDGETFSKIEEEGSDEFKEIYDELAIFRDNGDTEYVYTVRLRADGSPEYVVDSDPDEPAALGEDFECEEALNEGFAGETVSTNEISVDEWGEHLTAYSPIYNGNKIVGVVGVDISASDVLAVSKRIARIIIITCVAILMFSLFFMIIAGTMLRNSFKKLNNKVVELTQGNGDLTKTIDIRTGDEIETIAGNINKLVAFIRGIMHNISDNSEELKVSADSVSTSIDRVRRSTTEISEMITDINDSMTGTAASMSQFNDRMAVITDSVDGMVDDIKEGEQKTRELKRNADQNGKDAVIKCKEVHDKIEEIEVSLSDKIEKSKAVEQINNLTDNIINITDQTNLLSLNAAIEAARAGEAGKGFSVVAQEIGKLAEDSARAAAEIQRISAEVVGSVNDLAEESKNMLDYMGDAAISGYEALRDSSNAYAESTSEFGNMMSRFSQVGSEIYSNVDQMRQATGDMNYVISNTVTNLNNISDKASNMVVNMSNMEEQLKKNNVVSDSLYGEVGKFKL